MGKKGREEERGREREEWERGRDEGMEGTRREQKVTIREKREKEGGERCALLFLCL